MSFLVSSAAFCTTAGSSEYTPSDWARDAAEWAKKTGVFTGDSAGNFGWQQPITREAAAKLLYEYHLAQTK